MKFSLLISQFQEPFHFLLRMLRSIAWQKDFNFDEIQVIIGNDGGFDYSKQISKIESPFPILYENFSHQGTTAIRKKLLNKADGDYICFCDCDDCFSGEGVFSAIRKATLSSPDIIKINFLQEIPIQGMPGQYFYKFMPKNEKQWLQGKFYRHSFLLKNELSPVPFADDAVFVSLAEILAKKITQFRGAHYIWKTNPISITRKYDLPFYVTQYGRSLYSWRILYKETKRRNLLSFSTWMVVNGVAFAFIYYFNSAMKTFFSNQRPMINKALNTFLIDFAPTYLSAEENLRKKAYNIQVQQSRLKNPLPFEQIIPWIHSIIDTKEIS